MFNYAISKRMKEITNTILMIEPVSFRFNEQTAVNNFYQKSLSNYRIEEIQSLALNEFNNFVKILELAGINVIKIKDTKSPETPDSVFPNNWISFHEDGSVFLYPMFAVNRRLERRKDILDILIKKYNFQINKINDFTDFELKNSFLEGTGSMVLDRKNKVCYASISERTDENLVNKWCNEMKYLAVTFTSRQNFNNLRERIYHTNVMMCVADKYVIICLNSIDLLEERKLVINQLKKNGKKIIEISEFQKNSFAGNMLQVKGDKNYLVMSESAYSSLSVEQIKDIESFNDILSVPLEIIETLGGGSARCMMSEVFLPIK